MHRDFDTLNKFIEFKAESKNQLGNVLRYFDLIEVESTRLLSLILSLRSIELYPSWVHLELHRKM